MVTHRELLSLLPEVRTQVADATLRKRVPREPTAQTMVKEVSDEDNLSWLPKRQTYLALVPQAMMEEIPDEPEQAQKTRASHMPAAFSNAAQIPPLNATVITDPYKAFLKEAGTADPKTSIVITGESKALRAILLVVDRQDKVEAILDLGC